MLENLDSVDWAKLGHAYGEATDVPRQLRALASGQEKERQKALWDLHGNIWHQGTVYEATAVAVPFLLEMLKNDHPAPESILVLLALIANGASYLEAHGNLLKMDEEEYRKELAEELKWVTAAREAVRAGCELFRDLLESSSSEVRELSIFLLGILSWRGATVNIIEKLTGASDTE